MSLAQPMGVVKYAGSNPPKVTTPAFLLLPSLTSAVTMLPCLARNCLLKQSENRG